MSRLFKIVALAMLVVAVTAGGAMAAGSLNVTGKTFEYKLTTNGTYTVQSSIITGAVVSYSPLSTLSSGDFVRFTLTGAKFKAGETVYLSQVGGTSRVAEGTTTSATTVDIAVRSSVIYNIVGGTQYNLTLSTGPTGAASTGPELPSLVVDSGMSAGGTVTIKADAYNSVGAMYTLSSVDAVALLTSSSTNTLTTTFTDDATALNRTIDVNQARQRFTTTVPGNLTTSFKVVVANPSPTNVTIDQISSNFQYTLTVTGDLSGLTYIKLGTNTATTITAAMRTAGSAAITGTGNVDPLTNASGNNNVVFTVDGSTTLSARSLALSLVVTKTNETTTYGTAGNITPKAGTGTATAHAWLINGYQAVMPYGIANATYPTSCYISNPTSLAADAYVDIMSSQSGATLTSLTNISIGSIPAYSVRRVNLDNSVTPYLVSGVAGTAIPLTGLIDWDKYAAKFTVQGANASVTINCVQIDLVGTGAKRVVPVLTYTSGDYWRQ